MAPSIKQHLLVKNLPTSHVILYPSRAHVTRTTGSIELQPGPNEIEIYGLTPTADEHSIKVDGTGSASITDMTVDLVPNRDSFQDAYPDDDSDSETSDLDDDEEDDSDASPEDIKILTQEIEALRLRLNREYEAREIAEKTMEIFGTYSAELDPKDVDVESAEKVVERYRERRIAKHDEMAASRIEQDKIQKSLSRKERKLWIATREIRALEARKQKQLQKEKEKRARERAERQKEARRIREERLRFWPKKVYRVLIQLEAPTDTPGSSRRSSVTSLPPIPPLTGMIYPGSEPLKKPAADDSGGESGLVGTRTVSLTLSYVTSEASWAPRYDISFSTPHKSGSIAYRAEFKNATSETWKETRVSLSTSQASFRGLGDEVPWMHPWYLGLTKSGVSSLWNEPPGLLSKEEDAHKHKKNDARVPVVTNRAELFGLPGSKNETFQQDEEAPSSAVSRKRKTDAHAQAQDAESSRAAANALAYASHYTRAVATPMASGGPPNALASRHVRSAAPAPAPPGRTAEPQQQDYSAAFSDAATLSASTAAAAQETIEFQDSTYEDHGLTQTYDLPGTRTLSPSSLTRRHKIATLPFQHLILTSIAVPKLRAASFLRARFRNPSSSITLLKGSAGLTLDGTFLGTTTLPRVAPAELITLPLGVDPGVQVSYAKPTVKRSTLGVFSKEAAQVFTRSIVLTNSKNVAVEGLLVLDQVPISEDEKLRVEVLQPKGLVREGDAVGAGVNARQGGKEMKWGKATARLQKEGQIAWTVALMKGCACQLVVEYEVKTAASEGIISK